MVDEQRKSEAISHTYQENMEDNIDLLELLRTLLKHKSLILITVFGAAILAAGLSLKMTDIYRVEVLLVPVVEKAGPKGGGLTSVLGGLGGLAAIAGISVGGGGSTEETLAVLQSRAFLGKFVQEKKLMPILFKDAWDEQQKKWKETDPRKQPNLLAAHRLLTGMFSVSKYQKTDMIILAVEGEDQKFAAELANALVEQLNLYLGQRAVARSEQSLKYLNEELLHTQIEEMRKTIYDLIANEQKSAMLAHTQKEFAFRVIDPAVEMNNKIKPKRSRLVILWAFVAGFMAVLYVLIREGIAKRRERDSKKALAAPDA